MIDYGLRIGNKVEVHVVPKTPSSTGDLVQSPFVVVDNSIPSVGQFDFIENVFTTINDITLNWVFSDFEVQLLSDVDETFQEDKSMVKWYRKTGTGGSFDLVYTFNDFDNNFLETFHESSYQGKITTSLPNANSGLSPNSIVDKSLLAEGQEWYAIITPFDTIDQGVPVSSSTVTITSAVN